MVFVCIIIVQYVSCDCKSLKVEIPVDGLGVVEIRRSSKQHTYSEIKILDQIY